MSFSNTGERTLLDHIFKGTLMAQPTAITIGLSTADPLDTGGALAEPSGGSYARQTANSWNAAATNGAGQGEVTNNGDITFPEATGNWGTITHVAIFLDTVFWFRIALTTAKAITTGDVLKIASGTLKPQLD